ncbi:hypothetical protein [Candidatus Magnetobacterium casense]|uniref:Uncharacterized protein n=1 Tax=Candidatus Magnetobacterium casense TaxID=1455061 RepID=A0ABS6S0K4_9BACT|nr:hypothetical protein [Candidatus Magnetobacterium casensis]MBV6342341.1 hypothetical protein [Candidatus Magnetobacterium casensis]
MKRGTKLSDIMLAEQIQNLVMLAGMMDLERLKKFREELGDALSQYEAIGFMDGLSYLGKLRDMRGRFKRLEALIKFIEVSRETNPDVTHGEEEDDD